jgi:hypothetical protein
MNGEGSQTDRDATVEVDDNVIRLTDWLGPREELIPFGPGAEAEETARASHTTETGSVPTAEDFWSESSAAVQDALTAPRGGQDALAPPSRGERHGPLPQSHTRRGRASAAAVWARRRALLRSGPEAAGITRTLPRHSFLGVFCLILLATLVLVLSSGALTPGPARQAKLARTDRTGAARTSGRPAELASPSLARGSQPLRRAARGSGARHESRVRRPRAHSHPAHRGAAPVSVAYTTPAPALAATSSTSSTPPSYSSTAQAAPTTSASAAATTGGQKSSSAQPALGANGSLASGSSPDG